MISFLFRNIVGVALDTPSLDSGNNKQFQSHQILLGAGKWGVEHVANMDKLPSKGYTIYNMVFKLHEGTRAPTRLFATFGQFEFSGAMWIHFSTNYRMIIATLLIIFLNGKFLLEE